MINPSLRSTVFNTPNGDITVAALAKIVPDLSLYLLLLVILAPVMITTAGSLTSIGGSVIYTYKRICKAGQRFYCLRFRNTVMSSEDAPAKCWASSASA